MADLNRLKKHVVAPERKSVKSAPPPAMDDASDNLERAPRDKREEVRVLQFKLSESVFDEFTALAVRDMGFRHGAKIDLFLKMMEFYRDHRR